MAEVNNFSIVKIDRDEAVKFIKKFNLDMIDESKIIRYAFPLGYVAEQLYMYNKSEEKIFLTNLDQNSGIVAVLDTLEDNPLLLIDSLRNSNIKNDKITITIPTARPQPLVYLDKLEYLLYSFLLVKKIVLIGNHTEILKFLQQLYEFFPLAASNRNTFCSQTTSFNEDTNIYGIGYSSENLSKIDMIRSKISCVVDLENKLCYGYGTTKILVIIAKLLKENNYLKGKTLINEFLSFTHEVRKLKNPDEMKQVLTKYSTIGEFKLEKSDFELIKDINNANGVNMFQAIIDNQN